MDCQKCKKSVTVDRVIVERITGSVLGALCETCQRSHLSEVGRSDALTASPECVECGDPAYYFLPRIDCLIRSADGREPTVEYTLTDTSPAVCGTHFEEIVDTSYLEASVESDQALEMS